MRYPNKKFRKLVEFINEGRKDKSKKIYVDREPREIDWVAYNLSQINNIKKTMCHHTLKCVVCYRHLFLGCSEIKTASIHILKDVV